MAYADILASLVALIILEIILGVDNLVFLSILTEKLPKSERAGARRWGLAWALVTRLLLLASAVWMVKLKQPIVTFGDLTFSVSDLFLFAGGAFLIAKATQEIHHEVGESEMHSSAERKHSVSRHMVILQVAIMDVVFSIDSVLTAVGLTTRFWVMALAICCAIIVMMLASEAVSRFIDRHPTIKMLALSFLILIGMVLVADSFSFHIPRAYVYFAMGFSLGVEGLNHLRRRRRTKR